MAAIQGALSKRRKFVADGVFYAELNEFFQRELAEEGYSGVEVRVTPTVTDICTFTFSFWVLLYGGISWMWITWLVKKKKKKERKKKRERDTSQLLIDKNAKY